MALVDGDAQPIEPRLQVMAIILAISLFAVSFPGVSKSIPFLRIPHVVFFIGKHFGTGVILATAFIHLLQDSFEALQKPQVKEHYYGIGKHTGLIILASLLSIFLIEYLSTSYVDHLQAEPSLPPTPASSPPPSRPRSRQSIIKSASNSEPHTVPKVSIPPSPTAPLQHVPSPRPNETTPLLCPPRSLSGTPYITPQAHAHPHHSRLPAIVTQDGMAVIPIEVLTNSPRIIRMRGCTCVVGHVCACPVSADTPLSRNTSVQGGRSRSRGSVNAAAAPQPPSISAANVVEGSMSEAGRKEREKPKVGRRRQIIGLLVLQLGIMIHSIVIGLTLAITTGADFTSLTTAVIFHQLFEGLSLGIRIAALPPGVSTSRIDEEEALGTRRYKPEPSPDGRGFLRGMVAGFRGEQGGGWFKSLLAVLFAVTTPAGMGLGMIVFEVGRRKEGIELARMYLTQGLMSAISAGMLIYVSTVEMIAGDFVFGDVEGHSHHGHGHSHDLPSMSGQQEPAPVSDDGDRESRFDDMAENAETVVEHSEENYQPPHHHRGKIGKKVLAVASLLAGVGGMVLVGLGE